MKLKWEVVGMMGVDAGLCWVGDPCYVLHKEDDPPEEIGKNWEEFCSKINHTNGVTQFGPNGLTGVAVQTGYGDGLYPVSIKRGVDGRVMAVKVDFK